RAQHAHSVRQFFRVAGEVLRDLWSGIESQNKRLIAIRPDDLIQEFNGCLLLEAEAVPNRIAGVNQQPDAQRQVGLSAESANTLWRLLIIENSEVVLLQVFHEVVV